MDFGIVPPRAVNAQTYPEDSLLRDEDTTIWPLYGIWYLKHPKYLIKYDLQNLVTLQKRH
jgi:hypothetical protein